MCEIQHLLKNQYYTYDNFCILEGAVVVVGVIYGSYSYLCNQCLSPLTVWVRIPLRRGALDTKLCDKDCQWLATSWWFSQGTPVSSTNYTDLHDRTMWKWR